MSRKLARILAIHSAPAICGIKASNLINCSDNEIESIIEEIEELNKIHNPKVYFKILKVFKDRFLLLVYKRDILEKYIFDENNKNFLISLGYRDSDNLDDYLETLIIRLNTNPDFPHEVGIFLGYDLNDIIEFLNGNKNPIMTGYWKVYSNKLEKEKVFNKYTRCKNCVCKLVDKGFPIENFMK